MTETKEIQENKPVKNKLLYGMGLFFIVTTVFSLSLQVYREIFEFKIPEAQYISPCDGQEVVDSFKTQCTKFVNDRVELPIYAEIVTEVSAVRDVYTTTVYRRFCFPQGRRFSYFALDEYVEDANTGSQHKESVGSDFNFEELGCDVLEVLFWDLEGKARNGILYNKLTDKGIEDY
jgi:hypothetical protein